ncbi:MAG: hypothetical protein IJY36_02205 [Coprobacter sp.]|nr:hypothetical protein [Coprobacter sp.]
MKKTSTPSIPHSDKVITNPVPGPRTSTLMLLRQFARTYGIVNNAGDRNACLALN